jgi:hypothetical protein
VKVQPRLVDVTGDGVDEVVVRGQCPSASASNPTTFTVFDVSGPTPRVIGVLGHEHYYRAAKLAVTNGAVVVSGTSVGPDDPYCCANSSARDVYAWRATKFVNTSSTEKSRETPAPVAPAVSGAELARAFPQSLDVEGVSLGLNAGPVLLSSASVEMPPKSVGGRTCAPPPDAAEWFDSSVSAVQTAYGRAGAEENWGVLVARLSEAKAAAQYLSGASGTCRFTAQGTTLVQVATGRSVGTGASWSASITGSAGAGPKVASHVLFLVSYGYLMKITVADGTGDSARAVAGPAAKAMDQSLGTHFNDVVSALS